MQQQLLQEKALMLCFLRPQNSLGGPRRLCGFIAVFDYLFWPPLIHFDRYHIGESLLPSIRTFSRFIDAEDKILNHGFTEKVISNLSYQSRFYIH